MKIRDCMIGEGKPKVCIPILARNEEETLQQLQRLKEVVYDFIEVRMDYFEEVLHTTKGISLLKKVRSIVKTPILVTFRTKQEGGEQPISAEQYVGFYKEIIKNEVADFIDIELSMGEEVISSILELAKQRSVKCILSSHDFTGTPEVKRLVQRLKKMERLGADIAKIAVMPKEKKEVLDLMEATLEVKKESNIPIISMSMGPLGMISRIIGEWTGSSVTFATIDQASAPGQIPVERLNQLLNELHLVIEQGSKE